MRKITVLLLTLFLITSCGKKNLALPQEDPNRDFGIDIHINEKTIDNYLNREDSVYRDLRMLKDEANFEAIGGDSYLSGYIKGFEVVPYPYICNVTGLPSEVGESYIGTTLFTYSDDEYKANYKESIDILESLFPRDKNIFLMCGGGGYASMMKDLLIYFGYDETKIYNVGGYWFYEGNNKIEVKYEKDGETFYNLALVNYHDIDFDTLTPHDTSKVDETSFMILEDVNDLNELLAKVKTFALYVYLPGCATCASYTPIVREFTLDNNIDMYAVSLDTIWKSKNIVTNLISVSPAMLLVDESKVLDYLDANKILDIKNAEDLKKWFELNIDLDELSKACDSCVIE